MGSATYYVAMGFARSHALLAQRSGRKTWMPATRAGMTELLEHPAVQGIIRKSLSLPSSGEIEGSSDWNFTGPRDSPAWSAQPQKPNRHGEPQPLTAAGQCRFGTDVFLCLRANEGGARSQRPTPSGK